MNKGYKVDFSKSTITVNYTFAKAMEEYGSDEYNTIKGILADFPQMKVVVKAGREQKTTPKNKRMTYENMERYMKTFTNAEALLNTFNDVKEMSKKEASPYKFVLDWFNAQFPNHKTECPIVQNDEVKIIEFRKPAA